MGEVKYAWERALKRIEEQQQTNRDDIKLLRERVEEQETRIKSLEAWRKTV